jgi:hypothetical protein
VFGPTAAAPVRSCAVGDASRTQDESEPCARRCAGVDSLPQGGRRRWARRLTTSQR